MTQDPLALSADDILREGNVRGASPFETAAALQRWRSDVLNATRTGDGEQWANKVAKFDGEALSPVLEYLRSDALKQGANPEDVKNDPAMWTPAIQRLKAPIVAGGQQIGSFDLVMGDSPTAIAYSFNGPGNERVAIPLPKPTPEAIDARRKELAGEAERGRADAERAQAMFDELTSPPKDFIDALGKGAANDQGGGLGKQFAYQIEDAQRREREALLKLDNLKQNPELGFLSDQLEAKITSPELRDKFGGVRLGEDFQRGLASFYTGARVAWNDLTLDTPERQEWEKIHQAVPDIYPGTNQALKGPVAGTMAQLSETVGGQVLPLAVMAGSSGLAGPLAEAGSAVGLGMIGATSYGATRADSAAQSDYLKRQAELLRQAGHTQAADDTAKRAEMIAQSAVPRALATAATEMATEKMFAEERVLAGARAAGLRNIAKKTLTAAGQNAAEEATAQVAQGNVINPASGLQAGTAGDVVQAGVVGFLYGGTVAGASVMGRVLASGDGSAPPQQAPQGPPPPVQPTPQQAPEPEPTPAPDPAAEQRQRAKAAAQAAAPDPQTAAAVEQIFATAEAAANGDGESVIPEAVPAQAGAVEGAEVAVGVVGNTSGTPEIAGSGPAQQRKLPREPGAQNAVIADWDRANKNQQGSEWFEGGRANAEVNAALDRAAQVGGADLATHGMAKEATLTGAIKNLTNLLANGLNKARNNGVLHTAPLAVPTGSAAAHAGTTSGGTSYRDGPFILVQSAEASAKGAGIKNMADVHAVLVNDANKGQFEAIKAAILAVRPDLIVELYSNADKVAAAMTQGKQSSSIDQAAHEAATSPTNDLPQPTEGETPAATRLTAVTTKSGVSEMPSVETSEGEKPEPVPPNLSDKKYKNPDGSLNLELYDADESAWYKGSSYALSSEQSATGVDRLLIEKEIKRLEASKANVQRQSAFLPPAIRLEKLKTINSKLGDLQEKLDNIEKPEPVATKPAEPTLAQLSVSEPSVTPEAPTVNSEKPPLYWKGDQIELTGNVAPDGFEEFRYIDGAKAGQLGVRMTDSERVATTAAKKEQFQQEQEDFRRLRELQQEPKPTTVTDLAKSTTKAARNVDPEAFKKRVTEEAAPPEAPAETSPELAAEEAMPEPVKQASAPSPMAMKEQKKFLLSEIDKALEEAPDSSPAVKMDDALAQFDASVPHYKANESAQQFNDRREQELRPLIDAFGNEKMGTEDGAALSRLRKRMAELRMQELPKVTIEIPGDGTFRIINTKEALAAFKKRAASFPTTLEKPDAPRGPSGVSSSRAPAIKTPKTLEERVKGTSGFVSEDKSRPILNLVLDTGEYLVATNGAMLVMTDAATPKGRSPALREPSTGRVKVTEQTLTVKDFPDWKQVVPRHGKILFPDLNVTRMFTVFRQALSTVEKGGRVSVDVVKNPDGTLGFATTHARVMGKGEARYQHNIQNGAEPVTTIDAERAIAMFEAASALGAETLNWHYVDVSSPNPTVDPMVFVGKGVKFVMMPMRSSEATPRKAPERFQDAGTSSGNPTFERARQGDNQAFDDLDRMKRARYGEPPPQGRVGADMARDASHRRFTTDSFAKSFEDAFAAKDFDTALELIKQTAKGVYVPFMKALFKAEAAGDANAAAMADWMRHIFSGTRPANAAAQPPPQPAPPQQGSGPAGPAAQQPPPAPPPPPPSPPPRDPGKAFNMPALVRFLKEIKGSAVINRAFRSTRGAYRGGPNPKIELHQHLFKDPAQALKTFAHEIGHFIDYVQHTVKGSRLAARLVPMKNFGVVFAHLMGWSKGKMSPIAKLLRDEARALSRVWRGDFNNGDPYRDSSAELYADFMSALLTDPDWTMRTAPQMTNAFFAALEQKPAVEDAYNLLQTLLKTDTLLKILPNDASAASRSAIERVVAQVEAEQARRHSARAFMRGMWAAFVNRYDVIASKAGGFMNAQRLRRENFGSDFATQMEMADGYALREKALLENRLRREVYNPLAASGIDKEDLATVLKNNRILNERTATGAAIEANPNEARKLFTWMVEQSTLDQRQWKADIVQAADADLYALGARLMSKLHFNGDFERVTRAAQRQDAPDWAEKAMFAFDVSGFMMNPQGITPVEAQQQNDEILRNLGPQRAAVLQKSVQSFYDAMRNIVMRANDAGLFRPSLWRERIAPNLGNYVPFMVLDYLTGDVNASIKQRFGTFRDILPAHLAGALKAGAILGRIARQQSSLTLKDFFTRIGRQYGFAQEMTIRDELSDQEAARLRRAGGSSRIFWDKGQVKHMIFTDDTATWVDQPDLAEWMKTTMAVADSLGNFFKRMWTVFSFAFTIVSNPRRQILTTIDRGGVRGTAYMFGALKLAREYRDAHFSDNWTPRIRQLIAEGVLPPPQAHVRADIAPDEFVDELMRGVIAASNMRSPVHMGRLETLARKRPSINWTLDRMMGWNATVESIAKIGKYEERLKAGDNKAKAVAFARLEGIPNPGVNGGKYTRFFEPLFPFLRVHLQGLRATKQLATQKETRGGFLLRVTLRHVLSKGWVLLGAAGVLDQVWKMLFGDDKDQTDLQEFYRRVTPYKIENEDVIPLAWKTPTGWAPVMGHQTVPRDWVPVALRLGFSEEGRFVSPMLAATMFSLADKITGKKSGVAPVEPAARIADAMGNLMLPDFNPSIGITSNYFDIFDKAPPRDNYHGQAIATDDEWNAGYASRAYALTRAALSDFQVLGTKLSDAAGMKQQYQADDPFPFWNKMPGFKAMVASDNYAGVRDDQTIARDDAKRDAVARELRGPATKRAVSRMEGLERKGQQRRSADENAEYAELRKWYRTYYQGTEKNPALMSVLKKAAAGDKTVDVEYARKRLEETATDALKATKAGTPVTAP